MQQFRVNLKKKIDKYTKLSNVSYRYFKNIGISGLSSITNIGSTRLATLFEISEVLNIDVRNFLMFVDSTYVFKNSFNTFEEFKAFLGNNYRKIRIEKNLKPIDIEDKLNLKKESVYNFEARKVISLPRFYEFVNALDISVEEFFLKDEEYEVKGNYHKKEIKIEEFNNRIYEIEEIKKRKLGEGVAYDSNKFPTFHVFLKICSSLRIDPGDFLNFEKKDFQNSTSIDYKKSIEDIRNKINLQIKDKQKYLKLDTIFLFCYENGIEVEDFFDNKHIEEKLNQLFMNMV